VWIYAPKKLTIHKHGILHQQLIDDGYAKNFDVIGGTYFEEWEHPPLNAAIQISTEIKKRLVIN
jgi:mitochondrial fission protein ELM1